MCRDMTYGTSREELIRYLKQQAESGSEPVSTSLSRMASVRKVLSVLSDEEAEDVTGLDVEGVMRRFNARSEHKYSLASRISYKSRLRSSLEAFNATRSQAQLERSAPTDHLTAKGLTGTPAPRP